MTKVKMPEPDTHCFDTDTGLDVWSYSKAQLKQYGDDRAREALEKAAELCDLFDATHPKYLAIEILKLKDSIK